jgi:tetratricopeptide (TPR) repeat protein
MAPSPDAPPQSNNAAAKSDSDAEVLERDVPVSQSLIWKRQRDFYLERGVKAWSEDQVPSYVTNNPFIAEVYARIVAAYLRDYIAIGRAEGQPLSAANPLRILELGAGTGKFSYLFLGELEKLLRGLGMEPTVVRYCMTDSADSVLDEWRRNDYLAQFVAKGMLQFELFRAGEPMQSPFLVGTRGPLVVIANYVFDSLPHDAFRIDDQQMSEFLMTSSISDVHAGAASGDESRTSALKFSFRNALVPPGRYANPLWNRILDGYRTRLSPAAQGHPITLLFPSGSLAALQEIVRFSDGRMLVLAADKGFAHEDLLALSQLPPAFEFHSGNCFSQLVNLDAIGKYFEFTGGSVLRPDKHTAHFNVCGLLANREGDHFAATESAYRETQQAFGPDDLFTVLAWLNAHMEEMTVPQILAVLRMTRWDSTAFMRLFPVLARQLRAVVVERYDLREAAERVWANHYPVSHRDNGLAFQCGVVLLELKFFEDAAAMFRASQKLLGPSAPASYNLGLCAAGLGRREEALAAMKEACELDRQFQPAQDALKKLEGENAPGVLK